MDPTLTCPICSTEVDNPRSTQKYCSRRCKAEEHRRDLLHRYRSDEDYRARKYMAQTGKSRDEVPPLNVPTLKSCKGCGEEFEGLRQADYCTVQCRRRQAKRRAKAKAARQSPIIKVPAVVLTPRGRRVRFELTGIRAPVGEGVIVWCPTEYDRHLLQCLGGPLRECAVCGTQAFVMADRSQLAALEVDPASCQANELLGRLPKPLQWGPNA